MRVNAGFRAYLRREPCSIWQALSIGNHKEDVPRMN